MNTFSQNTVHDLEGTTLDLLVSHDPTHEPSTAPHFGGQVLGERALHEHNRGRSSLRSEVRAELSKGKPLMTTEERDYLEVQRKREAKQREKRRHREYYTNKVLRNEIGLPQHTSVVKQTLTEVKPFQFRTDLRQRAVTESEEPA